MAKTKKDKITKAGRRIKEIQKAHVNTSVRGQFADVMASVVSNEDATQPRKLEQRLHLKEVRRDLIKTAVFAVIVIVFLVVVKTQNLQLDFSVYK